MIRFTDATNLEEINKEIYVIRLEKFRLHKHDELLLLVDKNEDLPDVVGFLCKFDKAEPYGGTKPKRAVLHIYLEEDNKTYLTIWDDLADYVGEKLREINERTIVIVATSLLPKKFGGNLCLNPSSATKVYLNADFEAVRDFRGKMKIQPPFDDSFKCVETNNYGERGHSIAEILNFISNEREQEGDIDKDRRDQVPSSIRNIVGSMHKFQVKVTKYNFKAKYQSFTISRILDDIPNTETEELQQKEPLVNREEKWSSSTTPHNKIEEQEQKKESAKLEKGTVKRRKVQNNGKKTSQQHLEDSE